MIELNTIIMGDSLTVLKEMESESVDACITSPPYYKLRDYGVPGQIGLESTPEHYVESLALIFEEVRRILKPDGTLWLVIGDSYAGSCGNGYRQAKQRRHTSADNCSLRKLANRKDIDCKPKDLIGIPWLVAFALRSCGWYLRQDIIWSKPNCMPESVRDRCTKSHEYVFLFSKSSRYYFNAEAISEPIADSSTRRYMQNIEGQKGSNKQPGKTNGPMKAVLPRFGGNKYPSNNDRDHRKSGNEYFPTMRRNKRDVWSVATGGYKGAHFAVFPPALIRPCVLASTKIEGIILDPFMGAGTTAITALEEGRNFIGIELNPQYIEIANKRIANVSSQLKIPN